MVLADLSSWGLLAPGVAGQKRNPFEGAKDQHFKPQKWKGLVERIEPCRLSLSLQG